jgi:hypothetical protein
MNCPPEQRIKDNLFEAVVRSLSAYLPKDMHSLH